MATQLLTPNPNIPCKPGWCLQYVREAFGIKPGVYPSATAGWANAKYKHPGELPPLGVWTPAWFYMKDEPLGHVVVHAPDGSVYSTSDPSTVPHHHPSLDDLMAYYAYWGLPLTYLGWTEDIENVTVIDTGAASYGYDGEITTPTEEDDMFTDEDRDRLDWLWTHLTPGKSGYKEAGSVALEVTAAKTAAESALAQMLPGVSGQRNAGALYAALSGLQAAPATLDAKELASALASALPADLAKQVVAELGTALGGN